MALPIFGSRWPSAMLVSAAARLTIPSARTMGRGCFSTPILKLASERWAWAPQYLSAGTSMGPNVSVSVRVGILAMVLPKDEISVSGLREGRAFKQALVLVLPLPIVPPKGRRQDHPTASRERNHETQHRIVRLGNKRVGAGRRRLGPERTRAVCRQRQ